jgi:CheY-like chemotaxis protein
VSVLVILERWLMNEQPEIVTFDLISCESRAWTVIKSEDADPIVVEMSEGNSNHWSATVSLTPGEYHCRFYCGDDRGVYYFGPANINGSREDGMDALVSIKTHENALSPRPLHILLVEDNLDTLRAYAKLLRADGYVVHTADGYQTALAVTKKERIDCAVCDINLWDGDGCDLLRELQKLQPLKGVAVTGYTLPDETELYRDAGFGVILSKPASHLQITSAIAEVG